MAGNNVSNAQQNNDVPWHTAARARGTRPRKSATTRTRPCDWARHQQTAQYSPFQFVGARSPLIPISNSDEASSRVSKAIEFPVAPRRNSRRGTEQSLGSGAPRERAFPEERYAWHVDFVRN